MSVDCPFCEYLRGSPDPVFVTRGREVSVLLNPRQYERGALLVIPNRHVENLLDASDEEFVAVQIEARRMAKLLFDHLDAVGINVYQNAGAKAGQNVPHYHVHVVPRYVDSDPATRFREVDYPVTRREELQTIADALIAARTTEVQKIATSLEAEHRLEPLILRLLLLAWMILGSAALVFIVTAGALEDRSRAAVLAFGFLTVGIAIGTLGMRAKSQRGVILGYVASMAMFIASIILTI